ncbi:hypothetical protein QBC38DRAFT_474419 [Podospora fimiseda]|uniref:DUF1993 domain-containing protein n=1 Tax=Podospora fimiseda TaxID=252190 RepID=A0AAN7BSC9_9PEZI|nr:hypothetical protein QBC38DRAFT_474419 [Podospora fimiseda]
MSESPLYDFSIPIFRNGLLTLSRILKKAEAFAKANNLDPNDVYPQARLIEDQLPLVFQIQNATKTIRVNVDRLMRLDSAPFEDTEKTFQDLHARIEVAAKLLEEVDPKVVKGREDIIVDLLAGGCPIKLSVSQAVQLHGIPNFLFHITTAYSILRAHGVPLGKADFICSFVGL